ncbi:Ig-like domain-containing protein [Rhizobium sp. RCC_161_2]|uniref:Ig-like domain-containing protein n=1 Tax=Rhizobium sp. RCC_161_2 TaxID=3239219 RepID=UPI003524C450
MKPRSLIYLGAFLSVVMALSGCVSAPIGGAKQIQFSGKVAPGKKTRITSASLVKQDCTFASFPYTGIIKQPARGKIDIEHGPVASKFSKDSTAYMCSGRTVQGNIIFYTPNPGFVGTDQFTVRLTGLNTDGTVQDGTFVVHVGK